MLLTIEDAQARVMTILHANMLPNEADESQEQRQAYEVAEWIGAFLIRSRRRRWSHVRWDYAVERAEKRVLVSEALRT